MGSLARRVTATHRLGYPTHWLQFEVEVERLTQFLTRQEAVKRGCPLSAFQAKARFACVFTLAVVATHSGSPAQLESVTWSERLSRSNGDCLISYRPRT